MAPSKVSPLEFLENARPFPGENKFILGTFERGVTFYRQQIRALNLVYSLIEAQDSSDKYTVARGTRIAVIGGGAFGLTAAAAAAYAGFEVILLERQQDLLHLQRGCDTRWVHPRFYDWPSPDAESRLARLPMLDWPAGTAAQVATEVERQFLELVDEKKGLLKSVPEATRIVISDRRNGVYEVHYESEKGQHIFPCETIIYAVGFGAETGKNEPYWRNDRLGQTELDFTGGKRVRYVVSGVGDGGLVDVFRLTIRDFRHERIFSEMFDRPDAPVLAALASLQSSANSEEGWLFDRFNQIENKASEESITPAMNLLKDRIRSDTRVILNGKEESFRRSLKLDRVSFSNALLIYCLFRIKAITYKPGVLDTRDPQRPKLQGVKAAAARPSWLKDVKLVVRHGTDRKKVLRNCGCGSAIGFLEKQKDLRDSSQSIYPVGWWGRYTRPAAAISDGRPPVPVEFVPPALVTLATTFVSTLGRVLEYQIDKKSTDGTGQREFRVALHRLVRFDGRDVFQQITPYVGRVENKVGLGRFFPIETGIIGLASRTGSLVVARKTDAEKFDRIWELTNLNQSGAKPIKPYVDSIFACPFFAPDDNSGQHSVSLALFADSAEADFFDRDVLGTVSAACRGFVELLETLYQSGALRPIPTNYPGFRIQQDKELEKIVAELKTLGAEFVDASVQGWKEELTFQTLKSMDLEVGPSMKLV